jgi:hypothetical protein
MRIKFWTFFVLTFFVKFSLGQVYQSMPQYGYGPVKRMDFDSTLTIPTVCGVPTLKSNIIRKSAIAFDTCNNRFYFYNAKTLIWDTIKGGGSTIDTANKWVNSVTKLNDSTIRVIKGTSTSDISITTATNSIRLITKVWNKSGATITKGSVVYIDGAHSSVLPSIALAKANAESTSAYTYGLVVDDIADNSEGTVIQNGAITNLNLPTNTYTDGQTLYLSPTVAGGYTLTKPLAPNHYVAIGTITRAHPNQGTIQVAIRNGFQLDELSDVQISAVPVDSTLLQFSIVDSLWHDVSPITAIGSRYIKPTDTVSLSNRINLKLNSSDTASLSNRINLKLNISDTSTMLSKYLRKTDTASLSSRIDAKFTLPTLTSGSVLFSNGTTISQSNSNFFWDNTNTRLGIGTNAPNTTFQLTRSNTDYTNTNGAGSHIYMTNTSATGQNVVSSFINGSMVAKWRTDYQGNISWVAGSTGSHDFYTKGDYATGQIMMRIFNGGNVQISTSAVGGANADAGYKLDVQGTGRFTGALLTAGRRQAYSSKSANYSITSTDEVIAVDASGAARTITLPTAASVSGATYTIKKTDNSANAVTVGTTSSQTIDGSTTYSLATQYKYVTVVSNGTNWLIIANN